jgi:hypothetical protein
MPQLLLLYCCASLKDCGGSKPSGDNECLSRKRRGVELIATKQKIFCHLTSLMLASGLILTATAAALAQMSGRPGGDLNRPGMQPDPLGSTQSSSLENLQRDLLSNILRDGNAETALSRVALEQSSNENIRKLAQQTIANNLTISKSLYSGALGRICPVISQTPNQVLEMAKKMKELTGIQLDGVYLSQLQAYVRHDQKMMKDTRAFGSSPDIDGMVMQMRALADSRMHQIDQIASGESFLLR